MDSAKRKKLESRGFRVGNAEEFLGLTAEEAAYIELKIALGESLKERRRRQRLTQTQLAKKIQSSQSRVAKMEAGDPSVSVDLLVRSLLAVGASTGEIGKVIGSPHVQTAV